MIETLKQPGILDDEALIALKNYHAWPVTNHQGLTVGEVRTKFKLIRNA